MAAAVCRLAEVIADHSDDVERRVTDLIFEDGCDVNAQTCEGRTALMLACSTGQPRIVRILLAANANVTLVDHEGNTALDWALHDVRGDKSTAQLRTGSVNAECANLVVCASTSSMPGIDHPAPQPDSPPPRASASAHDLSPSNASEPSPPCTPRALAEWWVDLTDGFEPYDQASSRDIERAYAMGRSEARVTPAGTSGKMYRICFESMRQIDVRDASRRRAVQRVDPFGASNVRPSPRTNVQHGRHRTRVHVPDPSLRTEGAVGRMMELYHETDEEGARSIQSSQHMRHSPDVYPDGGKSLFGPLIYFGESPDEVSSKAHKHGAILQATVEIGSSVVVTKAEARAGQRYSPAQLASIGCDSVKGIECSTGNEWCVARAAQVRNLRVVGFTSAAASAAAGAAAPMQPFWLWPTWVQSLADRIGVVDAAIESVADASADRDRATMQTVGGVRVNATGRPIKSNGQFMSYAEARAKGWRPAAASMYAAGGAGAGRSSHTHAAASASTNPWNAFLHEHGGRGHSRAELSSMYAAGGGTSSYPARDASSSHSASRGGSSSCSGSACYSVSSNPSGPMKADGTPDMRYASNRR